MQRSSEARKQTMTIYPNVHNNLNLGSVYYCPVCRHGELSAMPLMEAMGCNFCRHIFTVNLERQLLKMADSHVALTWHWDGRSWKGLQKEGFEPDWFYWLAGVAFVLIPPLIVGFGAYLFPPLADDPLYWVPFVWTPLTFFCHLICLLWLVVEYYQFPVWIYIRAVGRRLLSAR